MEVYGLINQEALRSQNPINSDAFVDEFVDNAM